MRYYFGDLVAVGGVGRYDLGVVGVGSRVWYGVGVDAFGR